MRVAGEGGTGSKEVGVGMLRMVDMVMITITVRAGQSTGLLMTGGREGGARSRILGSGKVHVSVRVLSLVRSEGRWNVMDAGYRYLK